MAQNLGGAPPDNDNALKYDTPEKRAELLQAYVKHCEAGYPDTAFGLCSYNTLQKYIKDYPVDLKPDLIHQARAARERFWFDIGMRGTVGIPMTYVDGQDKAGNPIKKVSTRGFNAKSWQFIMMNMHGWRQRDDVTSKDKKLQSGKFVIYRPEKLPPNYDETIAPGAGGTNAASTTGQPTTGG